MRRPAILLVPLALALAACTQKPVGAPESGYTGNQTPTPQAQTTTAAKPPTSPVPAADGKCPYLDNNFVAQANGQRVSKTKVSADKPHPACFFYRSDGRLQLTVQVYVGDATLAKALVDQAAPVDTSDPAKLSTGWTGGSQKTQTGAVYAVAKGGSAVVISTNQAQTIKAKRVAEQAIEELGL
jgi:UPF0176 protein